MAKVAFIFAALFCLGLVHQGLGLKCMKTLDGSEAKEVTCDKEQVQAFHETLTNTGGTTNEKLPLETSDFDCLKASMKFENKEESKTYTVKSCVYKDGDYCAVKLFGKAPTDCSRCSSDLCNPAAKPVVSIGILSLVAVVTLVFKY